MLGMKNYPKKYIDECRSSVDADVAAYKKLAGTARSKGANVKALELGRNWATQHIEPDAESAPAPDRLP